MQIRNILATVTTLGALALATASFCPALPPAPEAAGETAIGHGKELDVTQHLVKGKTTIVDFYSEFCPPCRRLGPLLAKLAAKRSDLALVKVDINRPDHGRGIDWDSPLARQYRLNNIPYLRIYSPEGKLMAEGEKAMDQVMEMLSREGIGGGQ